MSVFVGGWLPRTHHCKAQRDRWLLSFTQFFYRSLVFGSESPSCSGHGSIVMPTYPVYTHTHTRAHTHIYKSIWVIFTLQANQSGCSVKTTNNPPASDLTQVGIQNKLSADTDDWLSRRLHLMAPPFFLQPIMQS